MTTIQHQTGSWYGVSYRGVAFNLMLVGYILLIQPLILESARDAFFYREPSYWLGSLCVVAVVLEFIYLPRKFADIMARRPPDERAVEGTFKNVLFVGYFFHMVVGILPLMLAAYAFGFTDDNAVGAMGALGTIKELVLGFRCHTALTSPPQPLADHRAVAMDLGVIGYSCLSYTLVWELMIADATLLGLVHRPAQLVFNLIAYIFLFFLVMIPLRLAYFEEELGGHFETHEKRRTVLSFIVLIGFTVWPMFHGHTSLENALEDPEKVEVLALPDQGLTSLPMSIGEMQNLRILIISDNELVHLPPSIGNLKALRKLDVSSNNLEALPASIGRLEQLEELDAGHNNLTALPGSLAELLRLRSLRLYGNPLALGQRQWVRAQFPDARLSL